MKKYFYRIAAFILPAYWFLRRPHTYGAKILIEYDGEYLFIRHTYGNSNTWTLPGGGAKHCEENYTAAVREVHEELGIKFTGQTLKSLGTYASTKEYKHDHVEWHKNMKKRSLVCCYFKFFIFTRRTIYRYPT